MEQKSVIISGAGIASLSAKVIVVYESKYGNTKLVAETIAEGMREVEGIEAVVSEVKEVDLGKVPDCDAILVGSPNHIGGPTGGIKKFIGKLGKLPLERKVFAAFDTYLGKSFEQATRKLEKRISLKVPGSKLAAPGLSIQVDGMKGPISEGELPKCKEFGKKIATQMKALFVSVRTVHKELSLR
jgi:flavorubredoxin